MLYTTIIAVCLAATPISDCQQNTAVSWTPLDEEQQGLGQCLAYGLKVASEAGLLHDGEYPKIFCRTYTYQGSAG